LVAPALSTAMQIPRGVLGPVISSGLVGMMIGAMVSGALADQCGRRPVLIGCAFIFGVGSLLTATAQSVEVLTAFRAATGLGMGGAMPNAIALTSEYMPHRRRGTAVTTMICGFSLGAAVGGFVAAAIIPRFGWQAVFVVGGVTPLLIAAAAFVWLPDSIRFLLVRGGADDSARSYLTRIAPGAALPLTLSAGPDESTPQGAFAVAQLFAARRGTGTILIWVVY